MKKLLICQNSHFFTWEEHEKRAIVIINLQKSTFDSIYINYLHSNIQFDVNYLIFFIYLPLSYP